MELWGGCPASSVLKLYIICGMRKNQDILGDNIKENESAGKTNKPHELWLVPEPKVISSLIFLPSQVTAGNRLEHRKQL